MIEVFITDIQSKAQADTILSVIQHETPDFKIDFDLNETDLQYPCGHTILRVEGAKIDAEKILMIIKKSGFRCEILEDKVCMKN